jgi:hypothetical protein
LELVVVHSPTVGCRCAEWVGQTKGWSPQRSSPAPPRSAAVSPRARVVAVSGSPPRTPASYFQPHPPRYRLELSAARVL